MKTSLRAQIPAISPRRLPAVLLATLAAGCAFDGEGESQTENAGVARQNLFGALTIQSTGPCACTSAEADAITQAHELGKQLAMTDGFVNCMWSRMTSSYIACSSPQADPYFDQPKEVQIAKALAAVRSLNVAPLHVECRDNITGQAGIGHYGNASESISLGRQWLNDTPRPTAQDIASVMWHEASHQQGYGDCDSDGNGEGYSSSLPQTIARCMLDVTVSGHTEVFNQDRSASLPLTTGRYTGPAGDFDAIGSNTVSSYRVGPASKIKVCANSNGTGCSYDENRTAWTSRHANVANPTGASYVEITPLALAYPGKNFTGTARSFSYGEYRASAQELPAIAETQSLYLPPGVRVRACKDEGGAGGHGVECSLYDRTIPDGMLFKGVTYIDVVPVVTAFSDPSFHGGQVSFSPGVWANELGLGGIQNHIHSLAIPPDMDVSLCAPGAVCMISSRSLAQVPPPYRASAWLDVRPVQSPRALTVNRVAGTGAGSVISTPAGIMMPNIVPGCNGTACSAGFHDRSLVRLYTTPQSGYTAVWSGCDHLGLSGNRYECAVSMTSARTVSVHYEAAPEPGDDPPPPPPSPECDISDCVGACVAEGGLASQCTKICRLDCP